MICYNNIDQMTVMLVLKSVGHAGYAEEGQDIICAAVSVFDCKCRKFRLRNIDRRSDFEARDGYGVELILNGSLKNHTFA